MKESKKPVDYYIPHLEAIKSGKKYFTVEIIIAETIVVNPRSKGCLAYDMKGKKVVGILLSDTAFSTAQIEYPNGPKMEVLDCLWRLPNGVLVWRSVGDNECKYEPKIIATHKLKLLTKSSYYDAIDKYEKTLLENYVYSQSKQS